MSGSPRPLRGEGLGVRGDRKDSPVSERPSPPAKNPLPTGGEGRVDQRDVRGHRPLMRQRLIRPVGFQQLPKPLNPNVQQEPDVGHAQPGDIGDLAIAQLVLKLEPDDFLLVIGQSRQQAEHFVSGLALSEFLMRRALLERSPLVEINGGRHAAFLSLDVQRSVPAHGEEPLRQMPFDVRPVFFAELEESLLHDISGRFEVSRHSHCIAQQRPFEPDERRPHPVGMRRRLSRLRLVISEWD